MQKILFTLALLALLNVTFANEVGNRTIVLNPKAEPLYIQEGKKVWLCDGLVNPRLIEALYEDFVPLAKMWGIETPKKDICLYSQNVVLGERVDSIQFANNTIGPDPCMLRGNCRQILSVRLMSRHNINVRSYTGLRIDESGQPKFFGSCSKLNGDVISFGKSCVELSAAEFAK